MGALKENTFLCINVLGRRQSQYITFVYCLMGKSYTVKVVYIKGFTNKIFSGITKLSCHVPDILLLNFFIKKLFIFIKEKYFYGYKNKKYE